MTRHGRLQGVVAGSALALLAIGSFRCSGGSQSTDDAAAHGNEGGAGADAEPDVHQPAVVRDCDAGWACRVDPTCGATPTVLTGKVFDPAGTTPLYNAVVYVPFDPAGEATIPKGGPTCSLPMIDRYAALAVTASDGTFKMNGAPTGKGVPVTVQVGKWRRTVAIDVTNDCGVNTVADGVLRLPRNHDEGDMPQMAVLTGGEDNMACFLLGMGVDASELNPPGGPGRVDVYRGVGGSALSSGAAGDCTGAGCSLWDTTVHLDAYDVVLLGCEGSETLQTKPPAALQAMHDWIYAGGQLFGAHWQDAWLSHGPSDFAGLATWVDGGASGAPGPFRINGSFPRGIVFRNWGQAIGIADTDGGLPVAPADVATSVAAVTDKAVAWILDESTATVDGGAGNVKAFSFSPPYASDAGPALTGCGRATLTDIHPGGVVPVPAVPSGCPGGALSPEEKALEYLFFRQFDPAVPICSGCPPPPPAPPPDGG